MFTRRLGQHEQPQCVYGHHCPQILEMEDGDFAVVGMDITAVAVPNLPPGPGVGPNEKVVKVPRRVFVAARPELPVAV